MRLWLDYNDFGFLKRYSLLKCIRQNQWKCVLMQIWWIKISNFYKEYFGTQVYYEIDTLWDNTFDCFFTWELRRTWRALYRTRTCLKCGRDPWTSSTSRIRLCFQKLWWTRAFLFASTFLLCALRNCFISRNYHHLIWYMIYDIIDYICH